tara:strand:- start:74 stop:853 length:780 start_codon:yes stop_codon:yes gene_type:complete
MPAFNFFEMILLISLAITFVLILFLVYHFKQRITTTEEKTDTMFDIINNMAQEMTNIRTAMNMVNTPAPPANLPHVPSFTKIDVSDEESDSEYETDSEDDESGDSEGEHEDEDEDSDDGEHEEEDEESDDDEHEDEDEESDHGKHEDVKHVSMDLDNEIDTQINSDDVNSDNNDVDEKEQPPTELNDTNLVVEKLDEVVKHIEEEEESESLDGRITYSHSNYRKMNLATLRQMVVTRGLSTDTSKMKKNDIIALLENNE